MNTSWKTRLASLAVTAGLALGLAAQDDERRYLLATAGTGGTYYPVGVAIATLVAVKLENAHGISMSAITSAGSGENIKLLREDQAQLAIVQGLWGAYAADGSGPLEADGAQPNVRAITMLWPNVEHFAIRSSLVDSGTVDDLIALEGHGFAIGARNSGTEGSNRHLLAGLGVDDPESHFNVEFIGYTPSVEAFQNGQIDAINPAAGAPVGAMTRLVAAVGDEVTILQFTDDQVTRANNGLALWTPFVIEAGTYPGQEEDITTIAQPNFLAVNADVEEEVVYQITKAIYENLPFLENIHRATGAMALDRALAGLPVPLHPGALRYYEEAGVDVPDGLRP